MTATEEILADQERCQPYLLRLRMLAHGEGEMAPTAAEVGQATSAIVGPPPGPRWLTCTAAIRVPGRSCGCRAPCGGQVLTGSGAGLAG